MEWGEDITKSLLVLLWGSGLGVTEDAEPNVGGGLLPRGKIMQRLDWAWNQALASWPESLNSPYPSSARPGTKRTEKEGSEMIQELSPPLVHLVPSPALRTWESCGRADALPLSP